MIRLSSLALVLLLPLSAEAALARPNILMIYLDDMGYGQPGCYGGKLAPTPHLDSIAKNGVRFTDGYVSACVCSPSRVGLMTGRYQARSGHDANTERPGRELVLTETTMAERLRDAGYATAIVGKWHLGHAEPKFLPAARGFEQSFGTVRNLGEGKPEFYRERELVETVSGAPITSPLYSRATIDYLNAPHDRPWFLYLAFNAVHGPIVASPAYLKKFPALSGPEQKYAAMIAEADEAIGEIFAALRAKGLFENTLVFCLSDNGGTSDYADNGDLRGGKWSLLEGGIRVSWLAQWPARIPAGRVLAEPVIQLDILPTMLAAADAPVKSESQLDGKNLLPLLEGRAEHVERDALFWRFGVQYAVRVGDWKLVKASKVLAPALYHLATDRSEEHDLAAAEPKKFAALQARYDAWAGTMPPPRWEDSRWNSGKRPILPEKRRAAPSTP